VIGLTAKQRACLDFIESFVAAHGYPPTIGDICTHLGVRSTNAIASRYIPALTKKGYITHDRSTARGIRVLGKQGPSSLPSRTRKIAREGTSSAGERFVFVEPQRDRITEAIYFPPTPTVAEVS
jgi:repressor LexA